MSFVHLHLHSEYSLLDGACRIAQLPAHVKSLGQNAVAITDHGVMYGAVEFYRACKKEGIKPIIGCEVYVAPRSRHNKDHDRDVSPYHMVLLCRNEEGYRNLCFLVSTGFTEGFYHKPRIDYELLSQNAQGLIALSGCMMGEIPRLLLENRFEDAKHRSKQMAKLFGENGFYLEMQDHFLGNQMQINSGLVKLHEETGIPLVATNDAHYLKKEDRELQDILMCIQMDKTLDDPNRLRFHSEELYVKSEAEMAELFPNHLDALENTQKIADLCQFDFQFGEHHLPAFPLDPEYADSFACLSKLCQDGFEKRYPQATEEHHQRLEFELNMIKQMGFVDYFLIVADFIAYARGQNIPVGPGRGSAAGSMVSYCLQITDVDPIAYSLYFERFLNPERTSMPDIDIDFCIHRRGEVIEYVNQKYGANRVAQIVTFGTLKARAVIRDVGRVMNLPYAQTDSLAKQVPSDINITLKNALTLSKSLKDLYDSDPQIKKLIDTAMFLEGMPRNASTHAAGVVVTKNPVHSYVPLSRNDKVIVTQYEKNTLEELGLLKMDFLGLRNLSVLQDTVEMIQKKQPDVSLDTIPQHDAATMSMMSQGQTSGVFQMESPGMIQVCMNLRPKDIEDITAIIALYRPGPMSSIPRFVSSKHNPAEISYKHPLLTPILSVTYGCIVYQEQVLDIFRQLAGYSLGQADIMRRAISKKKGSEIEKERDSFISGDPERNISGCIAQNIPKNIAEEIFNEIFDFANYAFNKAHAVCYAVIAYQTAYFKCHYGKEYMAALLTSVLNNTDKVVEYIGECKNMGIPLLSPDINESGAGFTATDKGIRFGLVAIKGVGSGVINRLLAERSRGGNFTDFEDFCRRMAGADLKRYVVEHFIRCGSFDSMGYFRSQLIAVYENVLNHSNNNKKENIVGQLDFFGSTTRESTLELPDMPEFSMQEIMLMEKEVTGLYLSGHPMENFRRHANELGCVTIHSVKSAFLEEQKGKSFFDGQEVAISGVITHNQTKTTRKNTLMAYVTLEDETASMELIVFARAIQNFGNLIFSGNAVMVVGKISVREEKAPQILVNAFVQLTQKQPLSLKGPTLYVRLAQENHPMVDKIKKIITMFPGDNKVILFYADSRKRQSTTCELCDALLKDLTDRLGGDNVIVKNATS